MSPPRASYTVQVDPQRHLLQCSLLLEDLPGGPVSLRVPTWVPGAYGYMKYARDVYDVRATDEESGERLTVVREGFGGHRIENARGAVRVRWNAYAYDPAWGELAGLVDHEHAVLLATRYLYLPGTQGPIQVRYLLPDGWAVHHPAGARALTASTFEYPSHEALLDTPVVTGAFDLRTVSRGGVPFHFVFLDKAVGFEAEVEGFIGRVMRVADACLELFGAFPFEHYTFIFTFNPQAHWGLEHANATMVGLGPEALIDPVERARGVRVCAHELFHAWNVCRLKPAPFAGADPATPVATEGLWISEGVTRYYEFLLCVRAGQLSGEAFFSNVVNYYRHLTALPAYRRVTALDSSLGTFLNHNRYPGAVNNTIDYYDKGLLIAFDLDAALRQSEPATSLDKEFRAFYEAYAGEGEGFTTEDAFQFFGGRFPPVADLLQREVTQPGGLSTLMQLERLGFTVKRGQVPYLGFILGEKAPEELADVLADSPAGQSGLAPGDELETLDGFPYSLAALKWLIARQRPIRIGVRRGHRLLTFEVQVGQREDVVGLFWDGSSEQASRIRQWLQTTELELTSGRPLPLDVYENFHGVRQVL